MVSLLISRAGIAAAAEVQRPVVSMWQSRPNARDGAAPFPSPIGTGSDLFDLDDVIAWQQLSGRGNNDAFAQDAPLHARTDAGPADLDSVTALLALSAESGLDLLDAAAADLVDAARDADPEDEFLLSEVTAAAGDDGLRALVQRQMEAAYGASAALEAVIEARAGSSPERVWRLTEPVIDLLDRLGRALAPFGLTVSDGDSAVPSDLALRVALADDERATAWLPPSERAEADPPLAAAAVRLMRRRALAAALADDDGDRAVVVMVQLPHAGCPQLAAAEVLRSADDIALGLAPGGVAVVVGPASALCDIPGDREALLRRADVLRSGRLRAAIRLPAGLILDKPRSELGLWLLGDADPQAEVGERLVVVGDVSRLSLTPTVSDGLVSDLVAALGGVAQIRVRAFAHARAIPTARVLADDGALVPSPRPVAGRPDPAGAVAAMAELRRLRDVGLGAGIEVTAAAEPREGERVTIEQLCSRREARIISGRRVDLAEDPAASVPIVGAGQVLGAPVSRWIGALQARGAHARGVTEPGDVVFVATPRPAALVDDDGGSLVVYPARILRLRRGSPHAVAAAINDSMNNASSRNAAAINAATISAAATEGAGPVRGAGRYQDWLVPIPADERTDGLNSALARLDRERHALAMRMAEITTLANHLVEGVTSGALEVETDMMHATNEGEARGANRAG